MSAEELGRIAKALERIAVALEGGEERIPDRGTCELCSRLGKLKGPYTAQLKYRCPIHWETP